ncbi:MAG: hypothetical protein ACO1OK_00290 [Devosia sp.]
MTHQQAFEAAIARAAQGLHWDLPCLIWLADYLAQATGRDPASDWRGVSWTERRARLELARLARGGAGRTAVECALDVVARRQGWAEADGPRQGLVMVGVYTSNDDVGVPAIFDGDRRWLLSGTGMATITLAPPERMWIVPGA